MRLQVSPYCTFGNTVHSSRPEPGVGMCMLLFPLAAGGSELSDLRSLHIRGSHCLDRLDHWLRLHHHRAAVQYRERCNPPDPDKNIRDACLRSGSTPCHSQRGVHVLSCGATSPSMHTVAPQPCQYCGSISVNPPVLDLCLLCGILPGRAAYVRGQHLAFHPGSKHGPSPSVGVLVQCLGRPGI